MFKIRIEKPISIRWKLTVSSRPATADDGIVLFASDPRGRKYRIDVDQVKDGWAYATFLTSPRHALGAYVLTAWAYHGTPSQAPVDRINAFELVPFSNMEEANIDPETGVVVLDSTLNIGAAAVINGHNTINIVGPIRQDGATLVINAYSKEEVLALLAEQKAYADNIRAYAKTIDERTTARTAYFPEWDNSLAIDNASSSTVKDNNYRLSAVSRSAFRPSVPLLLHKGDTVTVTSEFPAIFRASGAEIVAGDTITSLVDASYRSGSSQTSTYTAVDDTYIVLMYRSLVLSDISRSALDVIREVLAELEENKQQKFQYITESNGSVAVHSQKGLLLSDDAVARIRSKAVYAIGEEAVYIGEMHGAPVAISGESVDIDSSIISIGKGDARVYIAGKPVQEKLNAGRGLAIDGNTITCTLDLTLFVVCDALPVKNINPDKIYLVPATSVEGKNIYAEYIYANGQWEKLGEYRPDVSLENYYNKQEIDALLAKKQDTLKPGKNISITPQGVIDATGGAAHEVTFDKTISGLDASNVQVALDLLSLNKQDKLVAGNGISISKNSISAEKQVFYAAYGSTTFADIKSAYDSGKACFLISGSDVLPLAYITTWSCVFASIKSSRNFTAVTVESPKSYRLVEGQLEANINKVNAIVANDSSTSVQYPSVKAVIDYIANGVGKDKQNKLVPGDNITIDPDTNVISVTGNSKIFFVTEGTTTFAEIETKHNAGYICFVMGTNIEGARMYMLAGINRDMMPMAIFSCVEGSYLYSKTMMQNNQWLSSKEMLQVKRIQDVLDPTSITNYPSSKAVADYIAQHGGGGKSYEYITEQDGSISIDAPDAVTLNGKSVNFFGEEETCVGYESDNSRTAITGGNIDITTYGGDMYISGENSVSIQSNGDINLNAENVLVNGKPIGGDAYTKTEADAKFVGSNPVGESGYAEPTLLDNFATKDYAASKDELNEVALKLEEVEPFVVEYGVTPYADIFNAFQAHRRCICYGFGANKATCELSSYLESLNRLYFSCVESNAFAIYAFHVNDKNVYTTITGSVEMVSRRVNTITSASTTTQYPSAKAVYDFVGKEGVISQTQTWVNNSVPAVYTMSDIVRGIIPQANIDLFESQGAVFNEQTGYFELNGLTDLSYKEMMKIYANIDYNKVNYEGRYCGGGLRTTFPISSFIEGSVYGSLVMTAIDMRGMLSTRTGQYTDGAIESFDFGRHTANRNIGNISGICFDNRIIHTLKLRMTDSTTTTPNYDFRNCVSLANAMIYGINSDMSFKDSKFLTKESVLFMVQNAAAKKAITLTLHADVYAMTQADADIQAALASKTNLSLVSA